MSTNPTFVHTVSLTHIISGDDLWTTQKQIAPVIERALAGIGIAADQFHLDDLAAQIEVWKVRDLANELEIDYDTSVWSMTPDQEVELLFLGLGSEAEAARLEQAICSKFA